MSGIDFPRIFIVFAVLLFSLTVHEAAHAWSADRLGDPTARSRGRLSLNPLVHIDPIGTLKKIAKLAGAQWSVPQMEAAIEASRFNRMRAAEEKFGVADKAGDEAERFVRKGRVGSWQDEMGINELQILERKYGDVMRRVGYPPLS